MDIREIIEKSKEICKNSTCTVCDLKNRACIDKHGYVNAANEQELIALVDYLESVKPEKKGKKKK